jgi:hypothetical protein
MTVLKRTTAKELKFITTSKGTFLPYFPILRKESRLMVSSCHQIVYAHIFHLLSSKPIFTTLSISVATLETTPDILLTLLHSVIIMWQPLKLVRWKPLHSIFKISALIKVILVYNV